MIICNMIGVMDAVAILKCICFSLVHASLYPAAHAQNRQTKINKNPYELFAHDSFESPL